MPTRDPALPNNDREVHENVLKWIEDLNSREEELVILVEGRKDQIALVRLGIEHPIVELNRGMNIFDLVDMIRRGGIPDVSDPFGGQIVILTDWDHKGSQLASRIEKACIHLGVGFEKDTRKEISSMVGKWIKDIESIPMFLSHLDI